MIVFAIQAFALIASLTISLIITNLLGAAAYGAFSYGFSWVNLLATFSCMGYEQLALKELPSYRVQNRNDLIRGYFLHSMKMVFIISVLVSLLLFGVSWFLQQPSDEMLRKGLWLAVPVLPVIAMINLRLSWLRSFHFNAQSQLPDKVIRPAIFLLAVLISYGILKDKLNVWLIILLSAGSIVIALLAGNFFIREKITSAVGGIPPSYLRWQWTKVAFSFLLVNGIYFYFSQLQIIALGSFKGAKETGIFAIASRLSDLEGYMLFAMNVVLAPVISKLFAENNLQELQRVITNSLRIGFILSFPVMICFLLFPAFFLGFFGDEFGEGKFTLVLLTISQMVNFGTGSVGYLLTMTGHQRTAIQLLFLCALLTTLLSVLLIPKFGVNGAAIAAATNSIVLNVLMAIAVYRKIGINSTLIVIRGTRIANRD
ncbi:MAG TPA: oligosaccharide flippase family protein [Chitinophagales bacterium]|nr:oligosaccharide flippase family protein [Chitinophagales bacterium]